MIKILLMEDDLDLCQSIQQALKKEGYSVDCCNDGESSMIYALNTDYLNKRRAKECDTLTG